MSFPIKSSGVGYRNPPPQHRFQSGNLGIYSTVNIGREKPDLFGELQDVFDQRIKLTIKGKPARLTIRHALLLRLLEEAAKGRRWALLKVAEVIAVCPEDFREPLIPGEYQARFFIMLKLWLEVEAESRRRGENHE